MTTTAAGLYTASLWVRSDTPGTTLTLELSEQAGGVAGRSQITLTSAWQQVSVSYAPYAPGATTLDFRAVTNSPPGTCFYADDAAIVFQPGPAASLTVTPTTGIAPLLVRANASASTATEVPIASYSFNFGDGTDPVGPQTGATAEHSYAAAGTYQVRAKVTDTRGGTSYATSSITVAAGIVANPSFTDMSGWNTSGSGPGITLTRNAGYSAWGALLQNSGSAPTTCQLNDSPNWVATTAAGTYTASLWVRSGTPGATLKLKLREYRKDNGILAGSASSSIALTTAWQQVSVAYTPLAPGASTLDYTAYVSNAIPGTCFLADDAAIVLDPAGP